MVTRADIIHEALSWADTPYRHQHKTKGAGCDCLGLVRGVYEKCIGPEPETPPNYSPSWGEASGQELMLKAASDYLNQVDNALPGDMLVFRMKRGSVAKHCGILVTPDRMIHAYQGARRVTESNMNKYWWSRVVGVFRYPGVE